MSSERLEEVFRILGPEKAENAKLMLEHMGMENFIKLCDSVDVEAIAREDFLLPFDESHCSFNPYLGDSMFMRPFQLYGEHIKLIETLPTFREATIYFIVRRRKIRFILSETKIENNYLNFSIATPSGKINHKLTLTDLILRGDSRDQQLFILPVVSFLHLQTLQAQYQGLPLSGILMDEIESNDSALALTLYPYRGKPLKVLTYPLALVDLCEIDMDDSAEILYIGQSQNIKGRTVSHEKIQRALAEFEDKEDIYLYFFNIKVNRTFWNVNPYTYRDLIKIKDESKINNTLFPQFAKAGVLDGLSNTLGQTIGQVTNTITAPIRQVEGAIGNVENSVMQPVNSVLGGLDRTLGSFLAPFQQQLQQYFQVFTQVFQRILGDVFGGLFGGGQQPWNEQWGNGVTPGNEGGGEDLPPADAPGAIYGPLQLPDFLKSHKSVDQQVVQGATAGTPPDQAQRLDRFNINPVPLAQSIKFQQDRLQNHGMAATVLSSEGQAAMKQEMEAATQTLQSIQQKATQAQGFDVSQDVMKNLAAIQANQSSLVGGSYAQLMALRAQDAANAVVTSNISESLDEENRAKHAETMATADHVLRSSASFYLPGMVK